MKNCSKRVVAYRSVAHQWGRALPWAGLPSRTDYGLGVKANDSLIVERLMDGQVIGCDTFTADGRHTLLGINEKVFFKSPSYAIRGGCFMPRDDSCAALEAYVFAVLDALGFDWGAAHVEIMLTSEGPRLIEVNPRLVGAKIARQMGFALERSIHRDLIALHLGEWVAPAETPTDQVTVTRWIVADRTACLGEVALPASKDPGVRCVEVLKRAGDLVRPPFDNADRIGYVMVTAPTKARAEAIAEAYVASVTVHLREADYVI